MVGDLRALLTGWGGARVSARTRVVDGTARLLSWAHLERASAESHPHNLDAPTASGRKYVQFGANPPAERAPFLREVSAHLSVV